MPFILPYQRTKISNSTRFSKYKNIDESSFFLLQKLKSSFRSADNPTYRIITQHHPYYEVANGMDLDEMRENWDYLINKLPHILPTHLSPKARQTWFISHFTQLALETGGANVDENAAGSFPFQIPGGNDARDQEDEHSSAETAASAEKPMPPAQPPPAGSDAAAKDEKKSPLKPSASLRPRLASSYYMHQSRKRRSLSRHNSSTKVLDPSDDSDAPRIREPRPLQLKGGYVYFVIALIVNILILLLRDARFEVFGLSLLGLNVLMFWLFALGKPVALGLSIVEHEPKRKTKHSSSSLSQPHTDMEMSNLVMGEEFGQSPMPRSPTRTLSAASAGSGNSSDEGGRAGEFGSPARAFYASPAPSRSLSKLSVRIPMGATLSRARDPDNLGTNCWTTLDATTFSVRCGPNYRKNKMKKPSAVSLFEVVAVDMFATESKLDHILEHIALPALPPRGIRDRSDSDAKSVRAKADAGESKSDLHRFNEDSVTDYFVVNFQLPSYDAANPVWGTAQDDGPGYSLVLYFGIKESTKELLLNPANAPNSIDLLKRFFEANDHDPDEIRRRMKCIPKVANTEEMSLGMATKRLVSTYNGKPFMTGPRCHTFYRGENYLECDVDYHRFCYIARKGAYSMLDELCKMVIDVGMVVEGHSDDELPEQILGCARISKIDRMTAQPLNYWMQYQQNKQQEAQTPARESRRLASSMPDSRHAP